MTVYKDSEFVLYKDSEFVLYTDGGYRMNLDVGAFAWIITKDGMAIDRGSSIVEQSTSNRCEFLSMINGMEAAVAHCKVLRCVSDSQLMISQLNGVYQVKNPELKKLHEMIMGLCGFFDEISFSWNSRETKWTSACDKMCDREIDKWALR